MIKVSNKDPRSLKIGTDYIDRVMCQGKEIWTHPPYIEIVPNGESKSIIYVSDNKGISHSLEQKFTNSSPKKRIDFYGINAPYKSLQITDVKADRLTLFGFDLSSCSTFGMFRQNVNSIKLIRINACKMNQGSTVTELFKSQPDLEEIDTKGSVISNPKLSYSLLDDNPKLKKADLSFFHTNVSAANSFTTSNNYLIDNCPELESVDLGNLKIDKDLFEEYAEKYNSILPWIKYIFGPNCPKLKHVTISAYVLASLSVCFLSETPISRDEISPLIYDAAFKLLNSEDGFPKVLDGTHPNFTVSDPENLEGMI